MDMHDEGPSYKSTLILGRVFLMIAKTKIDVHTTTLTMEFGEEIVKFNLGYQTPT